MNKKILLIFVLFVATLLFNGCNKTESTPVQDVSQKETNVTNSTNATNAKYSFPGILAEGKIKNKVAVMETSKGTIKFDLYADKAPKTVSNFVYLSEAGFYNGLTFHRVVPDFVIQGGDPTGTGSGDAGYKFPDEPIQGEYLEGSVAMANSGPNTNGSQFFISIVNNTQNMAKSYNLFGQVTSGMDVVKKIQQGDKIIKITINDKS